MDSSDTDHDRIPSAPFDHRTLDRLLTKAKEQGAIPKGPVQLDEARRPVVAQPGVASHSAGTGRVLPKSEPDGTWAERLEVLLAWTAISAVLLAVAYVIYEALLAWGVIS